MKKTKYAIGVDIGGTKINTVLVDSKLRIRKKIKLKTAKSKQAILGQLTYSIEDMLVGINRKDIDKIGIGVPGTINRETGRIARLPNISSLKNFPIQAFIKKKFKIKAIVENDALCTALFEYHFLRKKPESLVVLTLGTGIGSGIILNGKPYRHNTELGHLTIERNGIKCSCGARGCLEEYFSVRAIERMARNSKIKAGILQLQALAMKGNKKALQIYKEAGTNLGIGLSNIIKALDPQLIVLTGGLAYASRFFLSSALKEIKQRTFFKPGRVVVSRNIENGGAIGATLL